VKIIIPVQMGTLNYTVSVQTDYKISASSFI